MQTIKPVNTRLMEFNSTARRLIPDPSRLTKVLSATAGMYISRRVPLPSGVVGEAESYYISDVMQRVLDETNRLNEAFLLNVDDVLRLSRAYWLSRYYFAYPKEFVSLVNCPNSLALSSMFGAEHFLSEQDACLLSDFQSEIKQLLNILAEADKTGF
jgi:hypothetical protein